MAILLSCDSVTKSFGNRVLFEDISFGIFEGERAGLIGPNGSGKTTLLRILAGLESADGGTCSFRKMTRIGYVPQEEELPGELTVKGLMFQALENEPLESHEKEKRIAVLLDGAGFAGKELLRTTISDLSGGWKKRLAITRELVKSPDLLLMDEPTNHLDLEGILWLENYLKTARLSCLLVSHDRYLLENTASRVIELNRCFAGGYFAIDGNYSRFLEKKDEYLRAQSVQEDSLANRVQREIEWLKRGAKARTTKSVARIKEAHQLMARLGEVKYRNAQTSTVEIDFNSTERETLKLLAAFNVGKKAGDRKLFGKLEIILSPGTRIGLVGGNGSGKTTLLRILAGELPPDQGTIKRGDGIRIVMFDQNRFKLDKTVSLRRALAGDGDFVTCNGRSVHVTGWAKRFLFHPDQLDLRVEKLSGGEQARILIAQLMREPADILLLDEPTNNLDIPSLEVLEESLLEFPGAVVLVTHDRFMLDRVSNVLLGLDGKGGSDFYADYFQWEKSQNASGETGVEKHGKTAPPPKKKIPAASIPKARGLTSSEQRELAAMEEKIAAAEVEAVILQKELEDPSLSSDPGELARHCRELHAAQEKVRALFMRWEELEAKKNERRG